MMHDNVCPPLDSPPPRGTAAGLAAIPGHPGSRPLATSSPGVVPCCCCCCCFCCCCCCCCCLPRAAAGVCASPRPRAALGWRGRGRGVARRRVLRAASPLLRAPASRSLWVLSCARAALSSPRARVLQPRLPSVGGRRGQCLGGPLGLPCLPLPCVGCRPPCWSACSAHGGPRSPVLLRWAAGCVVFRARPRLPP